jgi:hypothetical protein
MSPGAARRIRFAIAYALAVGLAPVGTAASLSTAAHVAPLRLTEWTTPRVQSRFVRTFGTFPQVALRGMSLARVNAELRAAVLDDQRRFAAGLPRTRLRLAPGLYETLSAPSLISASTVVVSMLVPMVELYPPGGGEGARWLSMTVQVHSGRRVKITDLFADSSRGLLALAAAAQKLLIAANPCVRGSVADPTLHFSDGFDAHAANYRYFALLPSGVTIGFVNGQVSGPACGRVRVTVPYSIVRPYLNSLGNLLIRGVRRPLH